MIDTGAETKTIMFRYRIYYTLKPFIPRKLQILFRRILTYWRQKKYAGQWPIDYRAGEKPKNFLGWPNDRQFAFVLSHDVDTQKGHDQCLKLAELEEAMGFKSSFNFVPERYKLSMKIIEELKSRGFEVCIHGLTHDGKLFSSRKVFDKRAKKMNQYIQSWGIEGFTAPSMICNLDWLHKLDIKHSTCSFDTDPFEPIPGSSATIFPFIVQSEDGRSRFVELPYTLPQDHCLYVIMRKKTNDIWKKKMDWIADKGGMALLNTHPDYMNFGQGKGAVEEYPIEIYADFLKYVQTTYAGKYWHALPREVSSFIKP